jgi:hypothetical protein
MYVSFHDFSGGNRVALPSTGQASAVAFEVRFTVDFSALNAFRTHPHTTDDTKQVAYALVCDWRALQKTAACVPTIPVP